MRILSIAFLLLWGQFLCAQTFQFTNTPHIDVLGAAERQVIPNQIKIQVNLRERMSGKEKISLDQLQKEFDQVLEMSSVSRNNVTLFNATSNFVKVRKKKGKILATKTYLVDLDDFEKTISFVDRLKDKGIQFEIREKTHVNIEQIKSVLKLEALKMAKRDAAILLKEVGMKKGKVLVLQNYVDEFNGYNSYRDGGYLNDELDFGFSPSNSGGVINFSPIKLKARVQVSFEILD